MITNRTSVAIRMSDDTDSQATQKELLNQINKLYKNLENERKQLRTIIKQSKTALTTLQTFRRTHCVSYEFKSLIYQLQILRNNLLYFHYFLGMWVLAKFLLLSHLHDHWNLQYAYLR